MSREIWNESQEGLTYPRIFYFCSDVVSVKHPVRSPGLLSGVNHFVVRNDMSLLIFG